MTNPASGLWIWIWNWRNCDGGDYDRIAARCKTLGITGVIVKAADGGRWYDQGVPISDIVREMKARGVGCATWDYCYGSDAGAVYYGYRVAGYTEERNRAVETITEAKPDFHVLDIEQEWEDQRDAGARADSFIASLKAGIPAGFPLVYAPLPVIHFHTALPYYQFTTAGYAMAPQLYWSALQETVDTLVDGFAADIVQYGLATQPIFPVYGDYAGARATDTDVAHFTALVKQHGFGGVSVWSYEHLDAAGWARVGTVAAALAPAPKPDPRIAAALAKLDALKTATLIDVLTDIDAIENILRAPAGADAVEAFATAQAGVE